MATQEGHLEVVKHLVAAKADLDKGMGDGVTPAIMAVQEGHVITFTFLSETLYIFHRMDQGAQPLDLQRTRGAQPPRNPSARFFRTGASWGLGPWSFQQKLS